MIGKRWTWGGAVLLATLAAAPAPGAAPAPAETVKGSPLAAVPAQAPIVIHLRGIERTKDRLVALVKAAVPPLAGQIEAKLNEGMKQALEGRSLTGLAKDGPVFVAFTEMPGPGQEPKGALIARVTSYKAFRDGVLKEDERKSLKADPAGFESATLDNRDVYFVDRKGYVAITPEKEVAAQLAKGGTGLDRGMDHTVAHNFLAADAGIYVDLTAVNKEFAQQIQQGRGGIKLLLQAAGNIDESQRKVVEAVIEGAFQLLEDSRAFIVTADFRPEGLALHAQVQVKGDSQTNGIFKVAKPGALTDLGTLPAGQLGYMGIDADPKLAKTLEALTNNFAPAPDAEGSQAAKKALDQLVAAGGRETLVAFNLPLAGIQVRHVKDAEKAVQAQLKLFQALKGGESVGNLPLKSKPTLKSDAQNFRGFKLNEVHMAWDFDKVADKAPVGGKEMADAFRTMMGESMSAWFGTDGKTYVSVTAKDWDAAQRLLGEYLDGKHTVGSRPGFQEARKQLPRAATLLALIDGPHYVEVITGFLGPLFQAVGQPVQIPSIKGSRGKSYLGFALTLEPENGSADFWLSAATVNEVFTKVMQQQGGAGGQ